MGTWGASINGNDTAQDLIEEYKNVFSFYDVDTAVKKIDQYVRTMFDESDEDEWCGYYYSLAQFMWKKGILTDEIRQKAIEMVDSDFGMAGWIEAGKSAEKERRKVLEKFKATIASPQCEPKKIKREFRMENIFEIGDIVTIRLKTSDRKFITGSEDEVVTDEFFESCDGKYIVMQKVAVKLTYESALVPDIHDGWTIFRLYKGIFDSVDDIKVDELVPLDGAYISGDGSNTDFKRRKYQILGKAPLPDDIPDRHSIPTIVYIGANWPHYNADSVFMRMLAE